MFDKKLKMLPLQLTEIKIKKIHCWRIKITEIEINVNINIL